MHILLTGIRLKHWDTLRMGRHALNCVNRTQLFGVIAMVWPSEPEEITAEVFTAWRHATMLRQLRPQERPSSPLDCTPRVQPTLDASIDQRHSRSRSRSRHERHDASPS